MGGWTWYYGLLNFAILAAGLYLIGKKIVAGMFKKHRDKITEGLSHENGADAAVDALMDNIRKADAEEEQKLSEIRSATETAAEQYRRESAEGEKELTALARLKLKRARERLLEATRRRLDAEAAAAITEHAATLLSQCSEEQKRSYNARSIQRLDALVFSTPRDREKLGDGVTLKVDVRSALKLNAEEKSALTELIAQRYPGADTDFSFAVEPALLGGFRVQVGDTVYDSSLSNKLRLAGSAIENCGELSGDISDDVRDLVMSIDIDTEAYQTGKVIRLLDGICHVSGLGDVMTGETVEFKGGLRGMVMNLTPESAGVVMLGDYSEVQEGENVRRTGRIVEVPVGEELIGRVVDALGRPIDGEGGLRTAQTRPVESPAPPVISRRSVCVPLETGIKAVDALIPIGRGQRELIIGDRQTGKTSIAIDAIINQKGKNVICIYVAIGQKESTVARVVERLREHGAMDYTTVVCANASDPAALLYLAPYAGCAMGEYFMYAGRDVLIVYDDLSKQAVAYREISLLLQRPPGREAYPGDIFYLHSRLLERSARLNEESGGGSMTALPIVETQAGNISAYIPTNVISITDGQLFLETELFNAGVRPAINVGLSVSRVGGSAQLGAMKQVASSLRLKLAQYRELEAFAQFGSEMDKSTRDTLDRGDRLTELLKQPLFEPMDAAEQVTAIFAVNEGYADSVAVEDVRRFEKALNEYITSAWPELHGEIHSGTKLTGEQLTRLRGLIVEFKKSL